MSDSKVQGEGDYRAAHHFREDTEAFVREHEKDGKPLGGDAEQASDELTPAERTARSRAKSPAQDRLDAACMENLEKKRES